MELPHEPQAGERGIHHQPRALLCEVIDDQRRFWSCGVAGRAPRRNESQLHKMMFRDAAGTYKVRELVALYSSEIKRFVPFA